MAGFTTADPGSLTAEPNVTPMIDVLLVLLIVFMLSVTVRHVIDNQRASTFDCRHGAAAAPDRS